MKALNLLLTLVLMLPATAAWAVRAVEVDDPAPDFTLPMLDGGNLRLQEQRGQVVLVNFWASWCGPCRQEMPLLDRMHQRYQDAGFVVLGVNVEGDKRLAQGLVQQTGVNFPILIDQDQKVSALYDVSAMPSSVVLDRNGVVRYVHLGYKPGDEASYLDVIQRLIRE